MDRVLSRCKPRIQQNKNARDDKNLAILLWKRGTFKNDNEYYKWWNTVKLNTIECRDITIKMFNEEHEPVVVWKVKNAFPLRYNLPI
ncbi:MAG: phage tail protein [Flavobacteriaceae bacterium]